MAEQENVQPGPLIKGSKFSVTIEDALPDVLIVCLNHGSKVYRGCLLDSNKSDMPYGVGFEKFRLQCENKSSSSEGSTVTVKPSQDEVSALSLRQTYLQDPDNTHPRLLPSPTYKTCITKPLRDKNIRNMRLRPRQVLCSKCKQGIHDTDVKNNGSDISTDSPIKLDQCKKRRLLEEHPESPKKLKKLDPSSKTSPVIKISFSSQKGRGPTIVKIQAKSQNEQKILDSPSCLRSQSQKDTAEIQEEYRKLKKALKKVKLREKMQARDGEDCPVDEDGSKHHHKKSKKHKLKKKHKHKNERSQQERQKSALDIDGNGSDFENERAEHVYTDKEPEDKGETYCFVNKDSQYLDSCISLKENSLNVPVKDKLCSLERNFEASNWSTGSDISDHSSIFDDSSRDQSLVIDEGPHGDPESSDDGKSQPLTMKIQTKNVSKCRTKDGRELAKGDVVWGKITGFPWWPGRIVSITVSQRDNGVIIKQMAHITWFGSSTQSHMPCSELHNFLQDFKNRFNKKKRGSYKLAIRQATQAAQTLLSVTGVDDEGKLTMDLED